MWISIDQRKEAEHEAVLRMIGTDFQTQSYFLRLVVYLQSVRLGIKPLDISILTGLLILIACFYNLTAHSPKTTAPEDAGNMFLRNFGIHLQ
jgi:hypothetical protein